MMKVNKKAKPVGKISGKNTRGYRLKPETHNMIVKIQNLLGTDQDEVIASACNLLFSRLQQNSTTKQGRKTIKKDN